MQKELKYYYKKYPYSDTDDFIKFVYQKHFGPAHFIGNPQVSYERICQECQNTSQDQYQELYEYMGGEYARINLRPYLNYGFSLTMLNNYFINSASSLKNIKPFIEDLCTLYHFLINNGFNPAITKNKFSQYRQLNYPPISHSIQYKNIYHPSYRVINRKYINNDMRYIQLYNYIKKFSTDKLNLIAIEGKCGSGKTTLTAKLTQNKPVTVISADDFFDVATDSKIGINSKRIINEVINHLIIGHPLKYQKYNCKNKKYREAIIEKVHPLVIIEGVFSANPLLINKYNGLVYIDINEKQQINRIDKRPLADKFKKIWIPRENEYYQKYNIKYNADLIV